MTQDALASTFQAEAIEKPAVTVLRRSVSSLWDYILVALILTLVLFAVRPAYEALLASVPLLESVPYGLLFSFPLIVILFGVRRFFNCSYVVQEDEIIARQGSLGFTYRVTRVRFSEIRYTRVCQNVFQRLLSYGDLCLFTTNHDCPDLKLYGIHRPQDTAVLIDTLQAAAKGEKVRSFSKA